MKKLIKLSLVITMLVSIMGSSFVYAAGSFNVELKPEQSEYTANSDVVVNVNLTNMKVGNGINTFGADLEYNKENFENVEVVGINGWNVDYNPESKRLVGETNKLMTEAGTILQIKFKAKAAGNIELKVIEAAGGEGDIVPADAKAEIKIGSGNQNPVSKPDNNPTSKPDNNGESNNPGTTTPGGDNSQGTIPGGNTNNGDGTKPTNTIKPTNIVETDNTNKVKIPQAGENNIIFYLIGGASMIAVAFFVRIKMMK